MVHKKKMAWRIGIYLVGMTVLALGITLNTLSGLGTSAIISMPYTVSRGASLSFANLTLLLYCVFVAAEIVIKGKQRNWLDLLQIPLSIVFTRFMALFQLMITYQNGSMPTDLLMLVIGILLTGIGAATTVDMMLIPNPGDGIVNSISMRTGKELGLCKNCFDLGSVTCSVLIGLAFGSPLLGVGLGTLLSMLGVGRVMAIWNRMVKQKLIELAGLNP
jgi:uncharacterized protein